MIGHHFVREREYIAPKSYCVMAGITMAFICLLWGIWLACYFRGMVVVDPPLDVLGVIVYPAVLFCNSTIISVLYIICAIQTRKQFKRERQQRKSQKFYNEP